MTRNDPMHKTVCDRCFRGTWYDTEQPCHMSRPTYCKCCHQATGDGPCGGTLRVIDRSALAPQFAGYYQSGDRIRVQFAYGETLTGTVDKTSGWRPAYMLLRTSRSLGSSDLLGRNDRVVAVKRGSRYVQIAF